jgi:hypothetical protein
LRNRILQSRPVKTILRNLVKPTLSSLLFLSVGALSAAAQGTAFTYQGQLGDSGQAANGNYDLTFGLYAASSGESPVGGVLTNLDMPVSKGFFTVTLDFGNVFDGTQYWLEIAVRTNGVLTGFTTLTPRQQLTPSPYALHAASASTVTGQIAIGQLPSSVALLTDVTNEATSAATAAASAIGASNLLGHFASDYFLLAPTNYSVTVRGSNLVPTGAVYSNDVINGYVDYQLNLTNGVVYYAVISNATNAVDDFVSGNYTYQVTSPGGSFTASGPGLNYIDAGQQTALVGQPVTEQVYLLSAATIVTNALPQQITAGGLRSIFSFGARGGTNDDTAAFQAALNCGQGVWVDPVTNYTVGNLSLKSGSSLLGAGSTIYFNTNASGAMFSAASDLTSVTLQGLVLDGQGYGYAGGPPWLYDSGTTNITRVAVSVDRTGILIGNNSPGSTVEGCVAQNFSDCGIRFFGFGGTFPEPTTGNTMNRGNLVQACWEGFNWTNNAEYMDTVGCEARNCGVGYMVNDGNNHVTGSSAVRCGIATRIFGGANPAHGYFVGCDFNHCDMGIVANDWDEGEQFTGCMWEGGGPGIGFLNGLFLTNVQGLVIEGCQMTSSLIVVDGGAGNKGGQNFIWNTLFQPPTLVATPHGGLLSFDNCISTPGGSGPGGTANTTNSMNTVFSGTNTFTGSVNMAGSLNITNNFSANGPTNLLGGSVVIGGGLTVNGTLTFATNPAAPANTSAVRAWVTVSNSTQVFKLPLYQ